MSRDLRRMYRTAVSAEDLPETISLSVGEAEFTLLKILWKMDDDLLGLRYGTNPHQAAALYRLNASEKTALGGMKLLKSGKSGLSATNVEDGYRALRIVNYFSERAVAVMKHLNPSGVGVACGDDEPLAEVFDKAWSGDSRAAYGSVVGFNVPVDRGVAENIVEQNKYVECMFAPSFAAEALELLKEKRDLRVVEVPKANRLLDNLFPFEIKVLGDTVLLEKPFHTKLRSVGDLSALEKDKKIGVVTERSPTEQEMQGLLCAWWVCCEKRSNGVVIWKRDKALGVGTGQQDRIGAIEIALARARRCGHDLRGSVLASDGYMLWDNVDPLAEAGISAIIQPGGSISDKELIERCNQSGVSMTFTGERIFRHF